jgi:hypothetical protein
MNKWTSRQLPKQQNRKKSKITGELFSIPFIGAFSYTDEIKSVLQDVGNRTAFVRDSILQYATRKNFMPLDQNDDRPDYINKKLWTQLIEAQRRGYYVDYSYVIAFYWLLSQQEKCNKSQLIREIIQAQI